jgi:D-threonate/D-erythronate kinase
MAQMLVIADDLTGAADCGVACAAYGLRTLVVVGESGDGTDAEALSIDADTRRLAPGEAAEETARLVRRFLVDGETCDRDTLLYKKLDSTMRGNVGAELAALLEARRALADADERIVAVLAPAFPATGRTTIDGRQLVNGKTLEEFGAGQVERAFGRSDLAATMQEAGLRPALLGLKVVRGDAGSLRETMKAAAQEADVLVCDAETDADLRGIAEASMGLGRGTVWAGSAGLARHLPRAAGLAAAAANEQKRPRAEGPVLFVVGSGSAVVREQMEVLASRSDTIVLKIPVEVLLAGAHAAEWEKYRLALDEALRTGRDAAIFPDPEVRVESTQGPMLTSALAALAKPFADRVGALVATGGETARAVFDGWGVKRLRLIGEVEAGLPCAVTSGWSRALPVLTKAGGFGGAETLLHCLSFLRGRESGGDEETR